LIDLKDVPMTSQAEIEKCESSLNQLEVKNRSLFIVYLGHP